MAKIINSITEAIGNTPRVRRKNYAKSIAAKGVIYAKVEFFNPGCSLNDRVGLNMISMAES
ncbi:MAG: cysteine synthase A, partial [Duncaniella sp.]|nr:cysteine synthase A [Duncaniella sp.]